MDLQPLMPWMVAASTILALGTTIFNLLTSSAKKTATELDAYKKANNEKIAQLVSGMGDQGTRIHTLEQELKHLPDRGMVHELQLTLKDIQIDMASIRAATEQATRTSQRVEGYLLERGKEGGN